MRVLKAGRITGLDDDGNPIGGDEPALKWLSAEVNLAGSRRLVLIEGEWFDLTGGYENHVRRLVEEAFGQRPDWALPAWNAAPTAENGRREEKLYNAYVARTRTGFLCLDRKLVYTRAHPRGFEASKPVIYWVPPTSSYMSRG